MSINLSLKQLQRSDIVADVRDALADRARARRADARDHRDGADGGHRRRRQAPRRAQGARRAARARRLRHRLLVAELPEPLPRRHPQDGPLVPAPRRDARRVGAGDGRRRRSALRSTSRSSPRGSSSSSSGRRFAISAAGSGRASTSRGRWTPKRPCSTFWRTSESSPEPRRCSIVTRLSTAPEAHRGPVSWRRCGTELPQALERDVRLTAGRWRFPRRARLAGLRADRQAGRDVARRHRDDGADDRLPAGRRRRERPLRPTAADDRRRSRARARRRSARRSWR